MAQSRRIDWRNVVLLAVSLLLCIVLAEALLRMFVCGKDAANEFQSGPYRYDNKYWKTWHFPDISIQHRKDCFDARYTTNRYGMRDDDVNFDLPGIALLGDSFVDGYSVNDNEHMAHVMQAALAGRYDVWNFGVSGGFSTVHELALYDNFVRHFHPKIVILFFLNYNDLYDNIKAMDEGFITEDYKLSYDRAGSFEEVTAYLQSHRFTAGSSMVTISRKFCLSRLDNYLQHVFNIRLHNSRSIRQIYSIEETPEIGRAWKITEIALERLNQLVGGSEGSRLVVVDLADPYQTDRNWVSMASMMPGGAIDPKYPNKRLEAVCNRLGITYYDMYDDVMGYIHANDLRFPYLSHMCDKHYNPLGHRLTAELVVSFLKRNGML